jgi:hypothetical protein
MMEEEKKKNYGGRSNDEKGSKAHSSEMFSTNTAP